MYLVDRGKLLMQMMHKFHYELPDGCNNPLYGDVIKVIEDAPLIEAEPVRHGRWEKRGQEIYCSECGEEGGYTRAGASRYSDYCLNCGAKMDGGQNNER